MKKFNEIKDYEIDLGPTGNPKQIIRSNVPSLLGPFRSIKFEQLLRGRNKILDAKLAANTNVRTQ